MRLTDAERSDLRIRIAATLAKRSHSEANLALGQFGFSTVADDYHLSHEGEREEYIAEALEQDNDDRRLEDLDYDLHARGSEDELADEMEAVLAVPGTPSTFFSVLSDGPHYLIFKETRDRIKAVPIFVDLLEDVVEQATTLVDPAGVYEAARLQRYPYIKRRPVDFEEVGHRVLLAKEFALLAWGPMFIYCFSVLERFLRDAVAIGARLKDRAAPSRVPNPQIESRINMLESFGFKLMLPPQTMQELHTLRPIRNNLTHELSLVADELPSELDQGKDFDGGNALPTPELVRRALRAVHDVVGAAEATFEIHASDAATEWHGQSTEAE
jgi:hypothetical protein